MIEDILVKATLCGFGLGVFNLYKHYYNIIKYNKSYLKKPEINLDTLIRTAEKENRQLPYFSIFVPAREETKVIHNTIDRIASIDYPKDRYELMLICDDKETMKNPEFNTKTVIDGIAKKINEYYEREFVKSTVINPDFDGYYPGSFKEQENKSTKGRALNWALRNVGDNIDMIGVYDADARPHEDVLKYAALRKLVDNVDVMQGPVYPVSNYFNIGRVSKFASLHLAFWHMSDYPKLGKEKKKVQFLAGTNFYLDKNLIKDVGGWDYEALTEDAELGLRLYTKRRAYAKWHPYEEIEQGPKNFKAFFNQRRRWAEGFLQLYPKIRKAKIPLKEKLDVTLRGYIAPSVWFLTEISPLVGPTLWASGLYDKAEFSLPWFVASSVITAAGLGFFGLYPTMYSKLNKYTNNKKNFWGKTKESLKLSLGTLPYWLVQATPEISAVFKNITGRSATEWNKTERTDETKPLDDIAKQPYIPKHHYNNELKQKRYEK